MYRSGCCKYPVLALTLLLSLFTTASAFAGHGHRRGDDGAAANTQMRLEVSGSRLRVADNEAPRHAPRGDARDKGRERRIERGRDSFRSLEPDEQRRLREAEQRYRRLPDNEREQLRERWERMSPDERARYRQEIERSRRKDH